MKELWGISCRNCGAPVGYDIAAQTYRCPHCGEISGVREVSDAHIRWRKLQAENRARIETVHQSFCCPNCGASVLFAEGEESEICDFCGSRLIRREFAESADFPEWIVPFVLTEEEARKRLEDWAQAPANRDTEEAEQVRRLESRLVGYYLPYQMVRGPISGRITRQQSWREYHCRGFLEGALVNTCRRMDNAVLDAIEPFDLAQVKPFEYGYVAGHKLRLSDLSPAKTVRRTLHEAEEGFRPDVQQALHTDGVRIRLEAEDLMEIPLLLPVYVLRTNGVTAAVNGQTGRVAVTAHREAEQSGLWRLEPAVLTVLLTLLFGIWMHFYWPGMLMFAVVIAPILFIGYRNGRYSLTRRIVLRGQNARAERKDGVLFVSEGENVLKNPLSNVPVFTEPVDGKQIPVQIRFYSVGRVVEILLRCGALIWLPWFAAILVGMAEGRELTGLHPQYGAAWYVPAGAVVLLYWIMGIRQDVYNHPLLYRTGKNGKKHLVGSRADRRLQIRSMLSLNGGEMLPWQELRKDEKRMVKAMAAAAAFLFLGSVAAILM